MKSKIFTLLALLLTTNCASFSKTKVEPYPKFFGQTVNRPQTLVPTSCGMIWAVMTEHQELIGGTEPDKESAVNNAVRNEEAQLVVKKYSALEADSVRDPKQRAEEAVALLLDAEKTAKNLDPAFAEICETRANEIMKKCMKEKAPHYLEDVQECMNQPMTQLGSELMLQKTR